MAGLHLESMRVDDRPEGIGFLQIDTPGRSVNTLSRKVLADLDAVLDHIAAAEHYSLLVIRGEKPSGFMAGADLHELAEIQSPDAARAFSQFGQDIFRKLEDLKVPTIALIHGPCLGGGLELALACDYRVVLDQPKTQLGLPEVELGLLPAWGGTQRLPRTVGLERALHVILAGRRLNARAALEWRLADYIGQTEKELSARLTLAMVRARREGKRPKNQLPLLTWRQRLYESTPVGRYLIWRLAERNLQKRLPEDLPAPWEALQAMRAGISGGSTAGLAYEREAAARLNESKACRNLIHVFMAREALRKQSEAELSVRHRPLYRIGIIGAGTMGAGLAQLAAIRGCSVIVREVNDLLVSAGAARVQALFAKAVEHGVLTGEDARLRQEAVHFTTDWAELRDADLVIEAVVEDLDIKRSVFQEVERHTRPNAVLATNTSSLTVGRMQEGLQHPDRLVGLHFFSPVHKMPLVEIAATLSTPPQIIAELRQWVITVGKTPIVVKDSPGFIVNRILLPYLAEAVILGMEGLGIVDIDGSMQHFGMPAGPFALLDQVGLDLALHIARGLHPLLATRAADGAEINRVAGFLEEMVKNGWMGQKSGFGFYRHKTRRKTHRAAQRAMERWGTKHPGDDALKLPRAVRLREARERMVLAMVNEAAACLGDGLCADAGQLDLAMILGIGWAPHRGGPLSYARDRGVPRIIENLESLARRVGPRFEPCAALREMAK